MHRNACKQYFSVRQILIISQSIIRGATVDQPNPSKNEPYLWVRWGSKSSDPSQDKLAMPSQINGSEPFINLCLIFYCLMGLTVEEKVREIKLQK